MALQKPVRRIPRWLKIVLGICALGLIAIVGCLVFITVWPDVAAENLDRLRDVIGDAPVAQLETTMLSIQDFTQQLEYKVGILKPDAPWSDSSPVVPVKQSKPGLVSAFEETPNQPDLSEPATTATPAGPTLTPTHTSTPTKTNTPGPSPTATMTAPYAKASCFIDLGEYAAYATITTNFHINVDRDSRDTISAYSLFVNSISVKNSGLSYTFPKVGRYTVKLIVAMKSGQRASCDAIANVLPPPTPTITPRFTPTSLPTSTPSSTATSVPTVTAPVVTAPAPTVGVSPGWQLAALSPLGEVSGEGQWSPYLYAADGQTVVAYRTYLQPDPQRPYSIPAVVAFNLQATRLHFVLGSVEPKSATPEPSRTGEIPLSDLQPGVLLAAFNGGFKARHGQYGAMADGIIALPPIDGLATVAMHSDGQVQIGQWGTDIHDSSDLVAWRQNGQMLIHNGQINPDTESTTVSWGLTVKGDAVTWRSALGLSADGHTLYYVAGSHLDVGNITKVMAQTGAAEALQLDVNNFWVHFTAIHSNGSSLIAEPLLTVMTQAKDRYLKSYSRDFFYVTTTLKP